MASRVIGPALSVAQLAATLSGVPFAAGGVMVVQMIHSACAQVAVHKQKSTQLVQRCTTLLNAINEQSSSLVGTDVAAAFDEAEAVLSTVHRRIQKWVHCGKLKRFLHSAQIAHDLDKCYADVDNAMERLHVANPVAILRMQQRSIDMMRHHQVTLEETLQQLLIQPGEIERAVQQHIAGGNAAYELMRLGQERLIGLRDQAPAPSATILSDHRQVDESPSSSPPLSPTATVQSQIEQALLDLHRLTNIPPTIPILNNQVKKTGSNTIRGGPYSHVYEGRWLGGKRVALKTLRIVDEGDPRTKRLQMRFEHEIVVWSKLDHENVLKMLGIVTNMGPIHIVSPWQSDHVRNYRRDHPDVNPLRLLVQAAKGLEYLHSEQIVHGHLKCTNMLVSEEGIVTLSDFGLTQVLTEVVGKPLLASLTSTAAVRWHAPELNEDADATPTMASDVFAFGMSVLELLTMKPPYAHRTRDVVVIRDLARGMLPPRPQDPEAAPWMSDVLWDMLNQCWRWNPEERLTAKELASRLEEVAELSTR